MEREKLRLPWFAGQGDVFGGLDRWSVFTGSDGKQWFIATIENGMPGDTLETEKIRAAFIVCAANNHYSLLEACKKLTAALEVHGTITALAELIQTAWEEAVKAIADAEKE